MRQSSLSSRIQSAHHRSIHATPQEFLGHAGVQGKALMTMVNFSIEESEVKMLMQEGVAKKVLRALRRADFARDREVRILLRAGVRVVE